MQPLLQRCKLYCRQSFAEANKAHIGRFLEDFKALDTSRFRYEIFLKDDGVTFVHSSSYRDEAIQSEVLNVPSFKEFQRLRDESDLNGTHKVEILEFIGAAREILS